MREKVLNVIGNNLETVIKEDLKNIVTNKKMEKEFLECGDFIGTYENSFDNALLETFSRENIHLCLRTLTFLDEGEWCEYINKVKNEVYWLLDPEAGDIFDVFKNCLNVEFIATRTDWTEKEIEIFVYGTNDTEKYKGIRLHAKDFDGKPMVIDLEESIRQRKIQKVVPNITA